MPTLPLSAEDDFGTAPFLSAESFAPGEITGDGGGHGQSIELSAGLAALVDRVRAEADDDEDVDPRLPSHRVVRSGNAASDDDDGEEDDIELEDLPPPTLPGPGADDNGSGGLEALEVSDEENGLSTGRRLDDGSEEDEKDEEDDDQPAFGSGRTGEGDGRLAASLTDVRI